MILIKEGIYFVGSIDFKRKFFDELIPLLNGTSYNSYLIKGNKKTVLIDSVDPSFKDEFIQNLNEVDSIDFIISNHSEQDHSGCIPYILEKYPLAKVICSAKAKQMLIDHLNIVEERIIVVNDKEQMDIGGKTLQFIYTPWVHWPETMCTYLIEDKMLFSCDFFGSHLATNELFFDDLNILEKAAKLYYSEIMMPFSSIIITNLLKINELKIEMILPSHGPVYKNPEWIIKKYNEWINPKSDKIILAYVSMHGSTKIIVEHLFNRLIEHNINVKKIDLGKCDLGEIAVELIDTNTLIIGSPCFLAKIHPLAMTVVYLVNSLKPKIKNIGVVGSYGWSGGMDKIIFDGLNNLNFDKLNPVLVKGIPKKDDFLEIDKLAEFLIEKNNA